jgi:leucyl-tRNA synthetase
MFNPPYGMRLTENDIVQLYQEIGDVLKSNWSGHQAWIITSAMDAAKFIGLRPSKRIELYNGPIEAKLLCFDLYEGSRKEKSPDYRKKEDTGSYRTGKTKYDLGRKEFLKEVHKYVKNSQNTIRKQIRKMGSSCDWSKERYTLDKGLTEAVQEVFIRMYKDKLIYKGDRL